MNDPLSDRGTEAARRLAALRLHLEGEALPTTMAAAAGIPLRTARRSIARTRDGSPAALERKQHTDTGDRQLDADRVDLVEGLAPTSPRPSSASIHRGVTGGNVRLVHRLFAQIERILRISGLKAITHDLVGAARAVLVIGTTQR